MLAEDSEDSIETGALADEPEVQGDVVDAVVVMLDLFASAAPEGQIVRRVTAMANRFAPQEISQIYRLLAESLNGRSIALLARLAPQWQYFRNRNVASFHRETLSPGAVLYRSAVQSRVRGGLVAFASGPFQDLCMPNARFLEMLGQLPVDVLILSNRLGPYGRWHMGGPRGAVQPLQRITRLLAQKGVVPRCYLGSSAGGEAAVVAASLDPGTCVITLAGRLYGVGRSIPLAQAPSAFVPICDCWQKPAPIHAIYNANEALDRACHQMLASMAPHARIYPIPDNARHNPMTTLAARGQLQAVMEQIGVAAMGKAPDFDLVCAP